MTDRVGQIFGSYRLIRLLEQNESAEVYLGEHLRLSSQQVAVKILAVRLQEEAIQAFKREAEHIAALLHPHIIHVLEFDVTDDIPFLVMDYAEQGSLRQRHKRGEQVPLTTIVPYIQSAADGLQYAHEQRIIHRAIKPDNMLISIQGEIVLSDFSITALAQGKDAQSITLYMAPEQVQGYVRPASDQYALGITVYEWLTGEPPIATTNQGLLPRLSEKLPDIPPMVERVVMTALEKNPHHRFATVRDFARALQLASHLPAFIPIPLYYEGPTSPGSLLYKVYHSNNPVQVNAPPAIEAPQEPPSDESAEVTSEAPATSSDAIVPSTADGEADKAIPSHRPSHQFLHNKWVVALAVLLLLLLLGGGYLLFVLFNQSNHAFILLPGNRYA